MFMHGHMNTELLAGMEYKKMWYAKLSVINNTHRKVTSKIKLSLCSLVIVHKTYYTDSTGIRSVDAQMSHGIIFTC